MEVVQQVEEVGRSSPKRPWESDVELHGDGSSCASPAGHSAASAAAAAAAVEDSDHVVVAPPSKKLCIEEAVLSTIPNVLDLEDLELQASDENSNTSECSALSKEDAARVLRSLEEELGVSSEDSDYDSCSSSVIMPSSAAQEALVDAALTSWGEEIWTSSCAAFESAAAPTTASSYEAADAAAQVDIGFLNEASDDELGIPPSPASERVLDDGTVKDVCEESMSVLTEAGSLLEDHHSSDDDDNGPPAAAGAARKNQQQLHEAVSWALQDSSAAEYPPAALHDMHAAAEEEDEDWLMPAGGLDFLLDFSTGYVPVAT